MKKIRNIFITLGVMTALIPSFLFYSSHTYLGPGFSMFTSSIAVICFCIASLMQMIYFKKRNLDYKGSALIAFGFIVLLIYINFFM